MALSPTLGPLSTPTTSSSIGPPSCIFFCSAYGSPLQTFLEWTVPLNVSRFSFLSSSCLISTLPWECRLEASLPPFLGLRLEMGPFFQFTRYSLFTASPPFCLFPLPQRPLTVFSRETAPSPEGRRNISSIVRFSPSQSQILHLRALRRCGALPTRQTFPVSFYLQAFVGHGTFRSHGILTSFCFVRFLFTRNLPCSQ